VYYIGSAKLNLTLKEVGRLTMKQFLEMYQAYKDTFDFELMLSVTRKTYESVRREQERSMNWE